MYCPGEVSDTNGSPKRRIGVCPIYLKRAGRVNGEHTGNCCQPVAMHLYAKLSPLRNSDTWLVAGDTGEILGFMF